MAGTFDRLHRPGRAASLLCPQLAGILSATGLAASLAWANVPPTTPTITQPSADGRSLNPEDVHIESSAFADADAGDMHACSDWEIWTLVGGSSTGALLERVWLASCRTDVGRRHVSLADGSFLGSLAGRTSLLPSVNYRMRVRHRDSSGDVATEWSAFAERNFSTAAPLATPSLQLNDIASDPAPALVDAMGAALNLPVVGANPATIRLEGPAPTPNGVLLLELRGQAGGGNLVINPGTIGSAQAVRVRISSGSGTLTLPESSLLVTDTLGAFRTILLPATNLAPSATAILWVALNGSTYTGTTGQTTPSFTQPARVSTTPWTVRRPGFALDTFVGGLTLPIGLAFIPSPGGAPDAPLFYIAELGGSIKLVRRDRTVSTYAAGLLNFTPPAPSIAAGEQGLTGICVQPGTGDVFASMLYQAPSNGPVYGKVVRLRSSNGGVSATSQATVLDLGVTGEPQGAANPPSSVSFGPDGKLYVHVGDSASVPSAQDNASFRGKVLRLNPDGTAPSDNPFYSAVDGITATDYIQASGLRNAFGGAWRNTDGAHYMVEPGPSVDRISKLVRGRNYLWDGTDASMAGFALYNWVPAARPLGLAFVQSSVFGGSGFPATMFGRAIIAETGPVWAGGPQPAGKRLTDVFIDASGLAASAPTTMLEYNGSGRATCAGVAAGPDGIYFTDLYRDVGGVSPIEPGGSVLRLRYTGEAAFTAMPASTTGPAPLTVVFNDTSTVPGANSWRWSFGDGATSTQRNPTHTYTASGCYTVRLEVTSSTVGTIVTQRPGAVRVSQPRPIAMIVGSTSLGTGDTAVLNALRSMCYEVEVFDDEATRRPGAAQLAMDYGLAIVSSSITAANVGGEFRTAPIPLVFWESALLTSTFESLSSLGGTQTGQTGVTVTNTVHPVTRGLASGVVAMFNSSQTISLATGTVAAGTLSPNATILATRSVATNPPPAILVAESGAALLGGYTAPARRVFLFFENTNFAAANTAAVAVLSNSVCWAMGLDPQITTQPANVTRPAGSSATLSVISTGHPARAHQWRKAGVPISNGGRISGATTPQLTISSLEESDAGSYDVVISTEQCGSITSAAAVLTLGQPCPADFNGSGTVTVQDVFDYLSAYFAGLPSADINGVGGLTVQDVFDFLVLYFAGCG